MFLTPEEIVALTRRKRRPAQVIELRYMGIEHRVRPDGSVAVLWAHVERLPLRAKEGAKHRGE
ncbi:MAG: DUF4224 domain-containing protein [Acidiferrobacterales bacterium]